ncbi:hypothetical protein ACLOJK_011425 [Asimina triloba]
MVRTVVGDGHVVMTSTLVGRTLARVPERQIVLPIPTAPGEEAVSISVDTGWPQIIGTLIGVAEGRMSSSKVAGLEEEAGGGNPPRWIAEKGAISFVIQPLLPPAAMDASDRSG